MMNLTIDVCRVCLRENATVPLFEMNTGDEISSKLAFCVNEPINDIEGYPKFICCTCFVTVKTVYEFIKTCKDSQEILRNKFLLAVKKEEQDSFDHSDYETILEPIEYTDVKEDFINDASDNVLKENEIIVKPVQKVKRKKLSKCNVGKTNNVASSILEGVFTWTGERWCSVSTLKDQPAITKTVARQPKFKKANPQKTDPSRLCDLCGTVFKDGQKLHRHKATVHRPKEQYACQVEGCKRICVSQYYLKKHVKRNHEGKRNYVCSTCGRAYVFQSELNSHNIKCHSQKPKPTFACKFCEKTYKCMKSVTIHERSVHTGVRPATCSVCNASFYAEEYLKQHMLLHTGETPFKCPICDRGYAQRGNMKSHMRHNHKLSDLDAEILKKLKPSYLKYLKPG